MYTLGWHKFASPAWGDGRRYGGRTCLVAVDCWETRLSVGEGKRAMMMVEVKERESVNNAQQRDFGINSDFASTSSQDFEHIDWREAIFMVMTF